MNKQGANMQFTADQVWGCAAAAQRINDGYFKEPAFEPESNTLLRKANKTMVKDWLRENNFLEVCEDDYAAGRQAREHFKSYMLLAMTGSLNDFQQTAYKIATKEEFTGRDLYDFAVISCLPSVAQRDQQRTDIKRELYSSEPLVGNEGDAIVGDITVLKSYYSQEYAKHKITARMGEAFVDFWFGKELAGDVRIKGKIKRIRGDKTTQLNYVKISG
jgi:hypothetical protein